MSAQKKAPRTDSPQQLNWNVVSIAAAILLVVVIGGSNYHLRQNRVLHIVSGFAQVASVQIEGQQALNMQPRTVRSITLPEGNYKANVKGATNQTVNFVVEAKFLDRWFKSPLYVLNVGGSALLIEENGEKQEYFFDEPFTSWRHVDYAFKARPDDAKPGTIRVDRVEGPVGDVFYELVQAEKHEAAIKLAEWHLGLHPEETGLLPGYAAAAVASKQEPRFRAFLEEGLKRRPVELGWHRYYQDYLFTPENLPKLVAQYDEFIKKEPKNSDFLYLRGRLCVSKKEASDYYNRALGLNFNNAFAQFALASAEASVGSWKLARPHITMARSMRPDMVEFQDTLFEIQLALGELQELETGLKQAVESNPADSTLNMLYCDVLAAAAKKEEAKKACETFERAWSAINKGHPGIDFRTRVLYSLGEFDELAKVAANDDSDAGRSAYFEAMVELGRLKEAIEISPLDDPASRNPFHFLALSVAFKAANDDEKATACRKRAIELMGTRPDYVRIAELLQQNGPVRLIDALDISLPAKLKAIVMVALAQKYPLLGKDFMATAKQLNVDRAYPYHLLNRVAGAGQQRAQAN